MYDDWRHATRDPSSLLPPLEVRLWAIRDVLKAAGIDLLILDCYRDPWTQARLYRKSRTRQEIEAKIDAYDHRGVPELGRILDQVGPQFGRLGAHVTWAGPGESWHQYRRAFDQVPWFDSKRLLWDVDPEGKTAEGRKAAHMWREVAAAVDREGLEWGGRWDTPDRMHVQMSHHMDVGGGPVKALGPKGVREWGESIGWW